MEDIFKKNLHSLIQYDPILATKIFAIKENKKYEVFAGSDPIDINIINKDNYSYMYKDPAKDIEKKLQETEQKFDRYPVLFFFGIGNGIFYKALLKKETHEHILVFEPDIEILYIVLSIIDFSEEILKQRLIIIDTQGANFNKCSAILEYKHIKPYLKTYTLQIHSDFYDSFEEEIAKINDINSRAIFQTVISLGNDSNDALWGIKNHTQNLPDMIKNYRFQDLVKARINKSKVAVVVSTGPSLQKQLPLLKKYAPYITIISVDASYTVLHQNGIKPDYVTSIEREPLTSRFFDNEFEDFDDDIYFVISSLTHEDTIKNLENKKLVLVMRPLKYETCFDLDEYGFLGIGMSASNLAYELAFTLGHKNIILIGQDLAFGEDGKSHTKGHIFSENEKAPSENSPEAVAYGGVGKVKTSMVWNLFRGFFEKAIEEAIRINEAKTYNATEGGSRIDGTIERPFKELLEELCDTNKEKNFKHIQKPSPKSISTNTEKAYKAMNEITKYGKKLQNDIERLFLKVVKEIEKIEKLKEQKQTDLINYENILKISDQIDKIKDKIESDEFTKMYSTTCQALIYHQELEFAKIALRPSSTDEEKKEKLIEWVIAHRYWLFSIAGMISAQIDTMNEARVFLDKEQEKLNQKS